MTVAADATPDAAARRVQVLLAARGGCRGELAEVAREVAGEAAGALGGDARVLLLTEIDEDPFPAANPLCRPFDVVLELEADQQVHLGALLAPLGGLGERLDEHAHVDLSGVLVGAPQALIPCEPTPLRYLYFMRRKAHSTRDDYLDYYFHRHSRFGFLTPNIAGYTQVHVDPELSATAARHVGLGSTVCDSVSELHLESLESFFAGIGDGRLGMEAAADEETFVDRDNSVSICTISEVVAP
jgi:hypothetical protein